MSETTLQKDFPIQTQKWTVFGILKKKQKQSNIVVFDIANICTFSRSPIEYKYIFYILSAAAIKAKKWLFRNCKINGILDNITL